MKIFDISKYLLKKMSKSQKISTQTLVSLLIDSKMKE